MLIVREVFTAKPGQATKLAKLFKRAWGRDATVRILTDEVGNYNTVVMEMQVNDLAEFGALMDAYRSGKEPKQMDPKLAEEMKHYTEMYATGRREIWRVVE